MSHTKSLEKQAMCEWRTEKYEKFPLLLLHMAIYLSEQ